MTDLGEYKGNEIAPSYCSNHYDGDIILSRHCDRLGEDLFEKLCIFKKNCIFAKWY